MNKIRALVRAAFCNSSSSTVLFDRNIGSTQTLDTSIERGVSLWVSFAVAAQTTPLCRTCRPRQSEGGLAAEAFPVVSVL
eukprot:144456-Prorocentrum_minimum.AAC.1